MSRGAFRKPLKGNFLEDRYEMIAPPPLPIPIELGQKQKEIKSKKGLCGIH